jgi:hypothetical protein
MGMTNLLIAGFTIRLLRRKTPEEGRAAMRCIYFGATFGELAAIPGQIFQ